MKINVDLIWFNEIDNWERCIGEPPRRPGVGGDAGKWCLEVMLCGDEGGFQEVLVSSRGAERLRQMVMI